ncbi:MAG: sel1 repeat family protein [Treponema sp.]|jgi:TPR repeat protein|nr:sel1 repeat family protein [Treponema sp.]
MLRIIVLALAIGVYILFNKRDKTRTVRAYAAYYEKKRKEFPWLEKWIQDNGDPSAKVAVDEASFRLSKILYFVMCGIAVIIAGSFPTFIAAVILIGLAYLICEKMGQKSSKNPGDYSNGMEAGLTLECPSCGCPNSWGMIRKEVQYLSYKMEENKFAEKNERVTTYNTKVWRDFECLNCGHTTQTERTATETMIENQREQRTAPDDYIQEYNPPVFAWEKSKADADAEGKELYERAKNEEAQVRSSAAPAAPAPSTQAAQTANVNTGISETLRKAAELGNKDACHDLALKYLLGLGVEKNYEQAAMYLEKCRDEYDETYSDQGCSEPEEFFATDVDLLAFSASEKDPATAFRLYQIAAELGNGSSFYELGNCYKEGKGVQKDTAKTVECYEKAANDSRENDIQNYAIQALGTMYKNGEGVPKDIEKARYWFKKGVDNGDKYSKEELKELK